LQLATRQNPLRTIRNVWKDKILFAASITDNFWMIMYVPLALSMNIGLLDSILVASTVLTILCGRILLKEKVPWYGYIFMAIILGCVITISVMTI